MDMIKGVISSQNPLLTTIFGAVGVDIKGDPEAATAINQLIGLTMLCVALFLARNCNKNTAMGAMVVLEYVLAVLFAPIYIAFRSLKQCGTVSVPGLTSFFGKR